MSITSGRRSNAIPTTQMQWGGLAETYVILGIFGLKPPHDAFPAARSAAERALALDGSSAQALTVLADVRKFYEWDCVGAEDAYRRAIAIDPHSALAHHWYAQLLALLARHDEAFAEIEAARQCDPVSPIISAFVSYILLEARQYDRAVVAGLKAVGFEPTAPLPYFLLGRAYAKVGEFPLAVHTLAEAVRIAGRVPRFEGSLGYAYDRAGRRAEAEAILEWHVSVCLCKAEIRKAAAALNPAPSETCTRMSDSPAAQSAFIDTLRL